MKVARVVEATSTQLDLTDAQAYDLARLGRQLSSRSSQRGISEAESDSSVIRCVFASPGKWNVSVDDAIGLIATDGLQIVVEPKIPMHHLNFLFERAHVIPRLHHSLVQTSDSTHLLTLVAHWYLQTLEALFRDDLLRDYRAKRDDLNALRGRIDAVTTVKLYYSGAPRLSCTFEDYHVDTALNRLLKAAADCVASNGVFSPDVRRRFRLCARRFAGVGLLREADLHATTDRRTAAYGDAAALARLLLRAESRSIQSGSRRAWAFLLPTPHVVEAALRSILAACLKDYSRVHSSVVPLGNGVTVHPDLIFDGFSAVGDIKYKVFESRWKRSDLYQVVAFAAALKSKRASVISFVVDGGSLPPIVTLGETRVSAIGWISDASIDPKVASDRLCDAVKAWLTS